MKIPKYMLKKIERRTKLAEELNSVCVEIEDWLEKQGIDLTSPDYTDITRTGCMIYCEPGNAELSLIRAIESE